MDKDAAPCPHAARVGQRLRGKWRLDRLLGVGGTAAVYAAVHRNGLRGAVKILHPELRHNPESRARFLYEGVVSNLVKHDGIVSILDDDVTSDGTPFLVMELLDGEAVDERLARLPGRRLGLDDTCRVVFRLLDVLAAAHEVGVTHRDVKPENVFLTHDGRVKLIDFGIAHVDGCSRKGLVTRLGYTMGTPAFMPPEQATGDWENVGPGSDVWAVGATMFNMLTGELVHGDAAVYKLLQRTATEPAPSIAAKMPELCPAVAAIVDRALAFEIGERYPSALAMKAALVAACPAATTRLSARERVTPRSAPKLELTKTTVGSSFVKRRSTALLAASVGSAIFAGGMIAWGSAGTAADDAATDVAQEGEPSASSSARVPHEPAPVDVRSAGAPKDGGAEPDRAPEADLTASPPVSASPPAQGPSRRAVERVFRSRL